MKRSALALAVLFTMLWTGTFWHDFFGSQILPRLTQAIASIAGEKNPTAAAESAYVDCDEDAVPVGKLAFGGNSVPPPGHVHSPWSLCRVDNPTARCSLPASAPVVVLQACAARASLLSAAPRGAEPVVTSGAKRVYLITRQLLI